eukprot:857788-Pyramimonas_sp.AAC.2
MFVRKKEERDHVKVPSSKFKVEFPPWPLFTFQLSPLPSVTMISNRNPSFCQSVCGPGRGGI